MYSKGSRLKGNIGEIKALGHGSIETAIDRKAYSQVVGTAQEEAKNTALSVDGAREVGRNTGIEQKAYAESLTAAGAENKGHTDGEFARRRSAEDVAYLAAHGADFSKQHGLSRQRETANSLHNQSIAEIASNGKISEDTRDSLTKINDGLYGHQMLEEAGRNNSLASVSADEADIFNRMAEKAGFENFKAQAGDRIVFSGAFDGETRDFKLSNIHADQMGQENRGENYNYIKRRKEEIVDSEGARSRLQTPAGKTVFETAHEGTRSDTGDSKTIHDNEINFSNGVFARKNVIDSMVHDASKAGFDLSGMSEKNSELYSLRTTASTTGVLAAIPTVKQLFDRQSLFVGAGLGVAEGASYLDLNDIKDLFKSSGKAEEINPEKSSGFIESLR
jgi:hypothetical protein